MIYDISIHRGAVTFKEWKNATDEELVRGMDALDATIKQPESGLRVAYCGPFAPEGSPHYEYWRRSVQRVFFNDILP